MFIKKDLRKIPTILAEAEGAANKGDDGGNNTNNNEPAQKRVKRDLLTDLRLGRRQNEFQGSLRVLCQPQNMPALTNLKSLSLYDCEISSLEGIGMLSSCPLLESLNLARNPLVELPEELGQLSSLKELFLDDCKLCGSLPECISHLNNLETLRASNNQINSIPESICRLSKLKVLCLDKNDLTTIPTHIQALSELRSLLLRHNNIEELPDDIPGSDLANLELLHLSSNRLTSLPYSIVHCHSLKALYANSNHLVKIPLGMEGLKNLQQINLSHNMIDYLPSDFLFHFGEPDENGLCTKDEKRVNLFHNPAILPGTAGKPQKSRHEESSPVVDMVVA